MSIDYIQRFWDALAQEVERLLGPYSAMALFARLFMLSPDKATILGDRIRLPTLTHEPGHGLQTIQPAYQVTRASEALTIQFDQLASSLIGTRLTATLLYAALETANRDFDHSVNSRTDG